MSAEVGIWDWDLTKNSVSWSEQVAPLFGLKPGEFDGTFESYQNLIFPDDRAALLTAIEATLKGPSDAFQIDHRLTLPDGSIRWINGRGRVYRDPSGKPIHMTGTVSDITDRKKGEESVRRAEELFRAIVDDQEEMIVRWLPDGTRTFVNRSYCRTFGGTPEDFIGKSFIPLIATEAGRTTFFEKLKRLTPESPVAAHTHESLLPDGSTAWQEWTDRGRFDHQGRLIDLQSVGRDVTYRYRTEQALEHSKALLQSFITNTPAAVAMFDKNLRYVAFSRRWLIDYNLGDRDLTGLHHYDVFPEIRNIPDWIDVHNRCLAGETLGREEDAFLREDGQKDWLRWEVKPWIDEKNEIGGVIMITEVITNRKRAEEALRQSEERFSRAFRSSPVGGTITRRGDGFIADANDAFLSMFGAERADVVGRTVDELQLFADPGTAAEFGARIQEEGSIRNLEVQLRRRSGEILDLLLSAETIDLAGVDHLLTTMIDITERKKSEQRRAEAEGELRRKHAELERFTYTVSHDLKSPLVTIQSFAGFIRVDIREEAYEKVETDLVYIEKAAGKMEALLNELLELSRIGRQNPPLTECPLESVVQEAADLVAGRIASNHVAVHIEPMPFAVRGERRRLVEVFQNLLDNAAKFAGRQDKPEITIGVRTDKNETVVFVRDNGVGIDPRHKGKLFGLFEKLHPETDGTGMGLAIVKRIMETHGGRVWFESPGTGAGTTFFCAFPGIRAVHTAIA